MSVFDLDDNKLVNADDAKEGWRRLLTWGHANLFLAGIIVGVVADRIFGWIVF